MAYVIFAVGLLIGLLVGYFFTRRSLKTKDAGTLMLIEEDGTVLSLYVELNEKPENLLNCRQVTFSTKNIKNPTDSRQ